MCLQKYAVPGKAIKSKGLERSLKTAIPKEVYEQLKEEMEHMGNDKVLSLVGLATRQEKVASGEFSTEGSVKRQSCIGYRCSGCISEYKKKFTNMCAYYQVPLMIYGRRLRWGMQWGKEFRASLAIEDAGF